MFRILFLLVSFFTLTQAAWAYEPPRLTGPVMDQARIIDPSDESYLESQIRSLNDSQHIQIQILTLESLQGEPIEQVSIDTVEKWQLGEKATDKGALILVAPNEKKVRIEVGQGLEGEVPDILAYQIIQQKILPAFRSGQYGKGLIVAVGTIEALASPETAKAARQSFSRQPRRHSAGVVKLLIFIFVFFILSFFGGRGSGGGFLLGMLLGGMAGGGRRGGFGGGGFGGGGWSGGGGGFSGGGASGGW